jgi:hypothetical protein
MHGFAKAALKICFELRNDSCLNSTLLGVRALSHMTNPFSPWHLKDRLTSSPPIVLDHLWFLPSQYPIRVHVGAQRAGALLRLTPSVDCVLLLQPD